MRRIVFDDPNTVVPTDPDMELDGEDGWKKTKKGAKLVREKLAREGNDNMQKFGDFLMSPKP